jgi:hypothetical protein
MEIKIYAERRSQSNFTAKASILETDYYGLGLTREAAIKMLTELLHNELNIDINIT